MNLIDDIPKYRDYIFVVVSIIVCIGFLIWVIFASSEGMRQAIGFATSLFIILSITISREVGASVQMEKPN